MAFPPEFSSTATYANRYDLDEINVFLEGDSSNPMFFNINGLTNQLSFGKHYFNLSILDFSTGKGSSEGLCFSFKNQYLLLFQKYQYCFQYNLLE